MKSPWSPIGLLFLSGLLRVVGRAQDAQSSSYPNKNTSWVLSPPPPRLRHLTKIIPLGFSRKLRYERVKSICNECHPLEGFNPLPPLPIDRFRYHPYHPSFTSLFNHLISTPWEILPRELISCSKWPKLYEYLPNELLNKWK